MPQQNLGKIPNFKEFTVSSFLPQPPYSQCGSIIFKRYILTFNWSDAVETETLWELCNKRKQRIVIDTTNKLFENKIKLNFQLSIVSIDSCIYQLLEPTAEIVTVIRTAVISFCVTRFQHHSFFFIISKSIIWKSSSFFPVFTEYFITIMTVHLFWASPS